MLSQGVIIYTFKSNWSNRELWNKQKQKENKSGLSKERVYSKELLSCGKNLQKDGDCLEQGAFSDYKSWSESGLLKFFFFLLQKEVNKAEKSCVFGSRMKAVGTGKKGWCDQKAGLRMSYSKASLFPKKTAWQWIVCWLGVRVSQKFQSLGVGDYLNQSLNNKHLFQLINEDKQFS